MAAELPEELVEQVLLRFPPEDPASLVRAALVSNAWCRLIAGRGFRRRFRELHRAAPMLGFICNIPWDNEINNSNASLVPTSSCLPRADHRGLEALDSRHGLVVFKTSGALGPLVVWNPVVSGEYLELPSLPPERCYPPRFAFNATVLCAGGDACAHREDEHFLVIFVGIYEDGLFTYMYSSEAASWSEPSIAENPNDSMVKQPAALVGNAIYYLFLLQNRILKYDFVTRQHSFHHMPPDSIGWYGGILLMSTEQGKLGLTCNYDFKLYQWSMEVSPEGDSMWTQDRVIELQSLLPVHSGLPFLVGYVHGRSIVLVDTCLGLFTVDRKLNQATKVEEVMPHYFENVVPYTSFHFPALRAVLIAEEPSAGASSA